MPEQISLDDGSYRERYEKAMERLREQALWWTNTQVSDPGIMLVEMWALLSDMQSYYLDQVQQSHYRKYLKLLGISPDEGACAQTWVFFGFEKGLEKECIVPRGTKLLSDRMVFETQEEVHLVRNCLQGFYLGEDDDRTTAMRLPRKTRFELEDDPGRERVLFTFVLDKPLKLEEFGFFVLLDERGNRNRVRENPGMVRLAWEYKVFSKGWQEAEVVRDDTAGLLFSGIVVLRLDSSPGERGYRSARIRCRIRRGTYDVMPALYKIYLNAVRVVQRDTLCCEEDVEFTGECHRVALQSYLARTGRLWVLKEAKEQDPERGKLWEDITGEVRIDEPVQADRMERCVTYGGTGHVKIVCTAAETPPEELTYRVTGIAAQRIALPWKKLMRSSVRLVISQEERGAKGYRSWDRADPEEDRYRNVWHWDGEEDATVPGDGRHGEENVTLPGDGRHGEESVIVLGDGRHGEIPPASQEGLRLTAISLWEGEKGNVPVGSIRQWQQPELFPGVTCTNYLAARGGRGRREFSEQFQEARGMLFRQNRMVTEEDIAELAMETPGLMIRKAAARWRDNTVTVDVFPACPLEKGGCVEWYKKQVEDHLMPYRLAGTRIRVEIRAEGG